MGNYTKHANAESNVNLNSAVRIDENSNIFASANSNQNKETEHEQNRKKTQFKLQNNNESDFSLKGVITSSSSTSIVIDNKTININSSITGKVKIVGNTKVGSYAMVQGVIRNSNFYAEKIIVDQRNKNEIKESGNETPTTTISPSITPIGTEGANVEENQNSNIHFDLGNIITSVQNFLNYLKGIAQKI